MDKLIEFRSLCDKLTDAEFKVFVNEILEQSNARRILTYLLYQFLNQRLSQGYAIEKGKCNATEWNQKLSEIILSRQDDDKQGNSDDIDIASKKSEKIAFGRLNEPILSKISTYLGLEDYRKYPKLNRLCYISCCTLLAWQDRLINSQKYTCDLTEYHKVIISQGHTFNAFWFRNIKKLTITIKNFVEYMKPFRDQAPLQCIEYLTIDMGFHYTETKKKFNEFITMNCINFETIKEIDMGVYDGTDECIFWGLISRLINVEKVCITGPEEYDSYEDWTSDIPSFVAEHSNECKKLTKLREFRGTHVFGLVGSLMVNAIGNQLTALKIEDNVKIYANARFPNLKKLHCKSRAYDQTLPILNTASNIEYFRMTANCMNLRTIGRLFKTQKKVMQIEISLIVEKLLKNLIAEFTKVVRDYPKNTLKIEISDLYDKDISGEQVMKLIKACDQSIENDFLLILESDTVLCNSIKEQLDEHSYWIVGDGYGQIEIANKDSKLSGWLINRKGEEIDWSAFEYDYN